MAKLNKRAPQLADPSINRALQDVYKEINDIHERALKPFGISALGPSEGKPGDIRLYEDASADGGTNYYLQGKFKDAWANINLTLQSTSPDNIDFGESQSLEDMSTYITLTEAKALINYSQLNANGSVGAAATQVASGNHSHSHTSDFITDKGTATHDEIDAHIDLGNGSIGLADTAENREIHALAGAANQDVSLTATAGGSATTWARSDHRHVLNQGIAPTWTGAHKFHEDVIIGESGNTAKLTINNTGSTALSVTGNMDLTGTLSIVYAEANSNDFTASGDATIDENVTLNDSNTIATNTTDYTTSIKGDLTSYGDVTLGQDGNHKALTVHASSHLKGNTFLDLSADTTAHNGHALEIKKSLATDKEHIKFYISDATKAATLNADTGGNMIIGAQGNIQLYPNDYQTNGADTEGAVLPKGTRITDMGAFNRLWRTGYFAEIYAETLVAQDVMATIGGRIMVAPTSTIEETLTLSSTTLKLKHNNFFPGDYGLLKAAPAGLPCFEVIQITSGPSYTAIGGAGIFNVTDATGLVDNDPNFTARTQYPERNLGVLITMASAHGLDDGDFVIIEGTGGNSIDGEGYDGAYKVAFLTGASTPPVGSGPCSDQQFYISAPFVSGNTAGGNVKAGPFTYTVRRNQDNTLANQWNIGDALVNIGYKEGDGYLELTSTETLHNALGPQMAIFSRTGTNLISNTGFDVNLDDWTGNGIHNTTTDHIYTGSGSVKLSRSSGNDAEYIRQTIPYSTGTTVWAVGDEVVIEAWVKKTHATNNAWISLSDNTGSSWYIADTTTDMHTANTKVEIDGDNWQRVSWIVECTSVASNTNLVVSFYHGVGTSSADYNLEGDIYIDNVSVYVNPQWNGDAPTVAVGNLNNYVDYNTDSRNYFGMAIGNDLTKTSTTGFKGLTTDGTNGVRLFNTDLSLYAGGALKLHSGIETIAGQERVFLKMGDVPTTPQFDWSWDGSKYVLTLNGSNLIISGTPPSNIDNASIDANDLSGLGLLTGTSNLDWSQITANVPDWATDVVDGITEGNANPKVAFGNTWIGFYKGWGTPTDQSNWPVRIANNSGDGELFLGANTDSSYLSYTATGGLQIKGSITVTGFSDPDNYIAASLTTDEIETLLGYTGNGTIIGDLFDASMNMDISNAYSGGNTFISGGVIASGFITADNIAAGTLTGRTVQTSNSGKRIVMSGSDNDLLFYNASGNVTIKMDDDLSGLDQVTTYPGLKVGSGANPGILHAEWNDGTMSSSFRLQSSIAKLTHADSGGASVSAGPVTRNGIYDYNSTVNTLFGLDIDVSYPSTNEIAALTISAKNTLNSYTSMNHAIFIKEGDIHSESQSFMRMWHTAKKFRAVATTGYESNVDGASKEIWFNAYQSQGDGLVAIAKDYVNGTHNDTAWTGYNVQVNKDGIYLINGVVAAMTNGMPGVTHMLRMLVTNSWNTGSQHYSTNQGNKHYLLHKFDVTMGDEENPEGSMPFSITIPLFKGDMLRLQHYNNSADYFLMYGSCTDANGESHEGSPSEDGSSISIIKLA